MPKKEFYFSKDPKIAVLLPVVDFILISVVLALSAWGYDDSWDEEYAITGLAASLLYIFLGNYFELFNRFSKNSAREDKVKLFSCWALAFMLTLFVAFLRKNTAEHSRVILSIWFCTTVIGLYLVDFLWRYCISTLHIAGRYQVKVAVAGLNNFAFDLINQIKDDEYSKGLIINGIYDDRTPGRLPEIPFPDLEHLGRFSDMLDDAMDGKFDVLFITLPFKAEKRVKSLVNSLKNTTVSVYIVPDSFIFELIQGDLSVYGNIPLIEIFDTPFFGINTFIKRIEDLVITIGMLPLLLPLLAVIAVIIKLTSRGPVIFKQQRYGINGDVIKIWKFRTMNVCEDGPKVVQATKNDARITPVGRFLRKTSLDEIPQFINVLQGRMSIVGPRPHAVAHNEEYRKLISGYMMRHKIKPGITGLAQINGYRGETRDLEQMEKRVELDVRYIREWNISLDIDIIIKTVVVVLLGKNAY